MDVTISQKSPVLIKAEVNVAWDKALPHYNKALNELRQHAQLPGFRKGKAPTNIIKKRFHQEITDDLARKIVPADMESWIKAKEIKAIGQPQLHHVGFKENDHFHYCVFIEVLPEFELQNWKDLEVEKLKVTVTDEHVEQRLENMIKDATQKITIEDRGIEEGDQVSMSLTVIDEEIGETLIDIDDYQIIPGAEGAHPKVSELIMGLKREEDASQSFEADADESHFEEWAGKKLTAYIEIFDVYREITPALDDAFAQSNDCKNLKELQEKTRENLLEEAENFEKAETRNRLVGKLMEAYHFEVPASLVMEEAQNQVQRQVMPFVQMMGSSFLNDKLIHQLVQSATPQAEFKIRTDLVLEKIGDALGVEISDEELDKELENYVEAFKETSLEALKEKYKDRGLLENVKLVLKRQKALEAAEEAAKILEVDELTADKNAEVSEEPSAETSETPAENESSSET